MLTCAQRDGELCSRLHSLPRLFALPFPAFWAGWEGVGRVGTSASARVVPVVRRAQAGFQGVRADAQDGTFRCRTAPPC
jgi:hypothetical protein